MSGRQETQQAGDGTGPTRVLDVEGTARERGARQGQAFRDRLAPAFEAMRALPLAPSWLPPAVHRMAIRAAVGGFGRYYFASHRRLLARREADGAGERAAVHGIAEGLGVAPALVYGLNAFEIESAVLGYRLPVLGCTSLALAGKHTASGAPELVYNHDFPPSFAPFLFVRRSRPHDGYRSISLAYSTLVGAIAGVNECGLAVSIDQAFATDVRRSRPALFVTMLVSACLERCSTVEEAIAEALRTPVTNGAMMTFVDASGNRAVVELSGTMRRVRREHDDRILHTFNKYRLAEMERVEIPVGAITTGLAAGHDIHASSVSRERRFLQIVRHDHRYTREDLRTLMSDHAGGVGDTNTICAHGGLINETLLSAILEPASRSLNVAFGLACEGRYVRISLDDGGAPSVAAVRKRERSSTSTQAI